MEKKYTELVDLKELISSKRTYRYVSARTSMSLRALNNKLNGYNSFDCNEIMEICELFGIDNNEVVYYFFPPMLQKARQTKINKE